MSSYPPGRRTVHGMEYDDAVKGHAKDYQRRRREEAEAQRLRARARRSASARASLIRLGLIAGLAVTVVMAALALIV